MLGSSGAEVFCFFSLTLFFSFLFVGKKSTAEAQIAIANVFLFHLKHDDDDDPNDDDDDD